MTSPQFWGPKCCLHKKVENMESRVHRVGEMDLHSRRYRDLMELLWVGLRLPQRVDSPPPPRPLLE